MTRAVVLQREGFTPDDALTSALFDRMTVKSEVEGRKILESMPTGVIMDVFERKFGEKISEEEVKMFIQFISSGHTPAERKDVLESWHDDREQARAGVATESQFAVVRGTDSLVSIEKSREEALKNAPENRQ